MVKGRDGIMRETGSERVFSFLNYIVLTLFGVMCILPVINVLALSFSSTRAVTSGEVSLWPVEFTLDTYKKLVFGKVRVFDGFTNSVVITVVGVALSVIFTVLAAYPLSRKFFIGRKFFTLAIVFTMLFSGGIIPTYLLVKGLGIMNSYGALWFTGLISAYNMLVMRSYFESLPIELDEAARIDGCSELRLLMQIILPLSKPVLATIALFYAVGYWNGFFHVLLYISDGKKHNLATVIQQMIQNQSVTSEVMNEGNEIQLTEQSVISASVVVMIAPMLILYPFVQKYFIKGVMLGAVKG